MIYNNKDFWRHFATLQTITAKKIAFHNHNRNFFPKSCSPDMIQDEIRLKERMRREQAKMCKEKRSKRKRGEENLLCCSYWTKGWLHNTLHALKHTSCAFTHTGTYAASCSCMTKAFHVSVTPCAPLIISKPALTSEFTKLLNLTVCSRSDTHSPALLYMTLTEESLQGLFSPSFCHAHFDILILLQKLKIVWESGDSPERRTGRENEWWDKTRIKETKNKVRWGNMNMRDERKDET